MLVVGFAAGGPTDVLARLMAQSLSERLGQQFIVENKPGAGGSIAGGIVAKAPKDGYNLAALAMGHSVSAVMVKNVPYDPVNLVGESKLLDRYRDESSRLEGVSFVGRLATFRYLDMDVAISEALEASRVTQERLAAGVSIPAFFDAD